MVSITHRADSAGLNMLLLITVVEKDEDDKVSNGCPKMMPEYWLEYNSGCHDGSVIKGGETEDPENEEQALFTGVSLVIMSTADSTILW